MIRESTTSIEVSRGAALDRQSPRLLFKGLYARPVWAFAASTMLLFLILAVIGPWIVPYGINEQIYSEAFQSPSIRHFFGTDNLGRDVFSRVILGTGSVLALAGIGTFLAMLFGTAIGLVSGYLGGLFDELLMRVFDSLLALPALLLSLLLLAISGQNSINILIVIVVVYSPIIARVVRSVVLGVKEMSFVEAARLRGESLGWILFREILPSVYPALAVEVALRFSYAIFLVASLGFLGVGVQPPSPNWGLMVKEARSFVTQAPWGMYFPVGAISLLVVSVNLTADALKRLLHGEV